LFSYKAEMETSSVYVGGEGLMVHSVGYPHHILLHFFFTY
jgi:hypothetical protein